MNGLRHKAEGISGTLLAIRIGENWNAISFVMTLLMGE